MNRITKEVKAIADAHIEARKNNKFDDPKCKTKQEVFEALRAGKTFSEVLYQVEARYCTVGSVLISTTLLHTSDNYRSGVYKGFKKIFS